MDPIPEKIEVKLALLPEETEIALDKLGLTAPAKEEKRIHFLDTAELAFFDRGLILRVRQVLTGNDKDDATLKVRGDKAPEIAQRPLTTNTIAKFEGDKTVGHDETPSFSITTEPHAGAFKVVLEEDETPEALLDANGRMLFHEFGAGAVQRSILRLGPIRSRSWKLQPEGFAGKLTAELWGVAGTSLFELSAKVLRSEAPEFEAKLVALAASLGLRPLAKSKTRFALEKLRSPST
jgi:hypothetical protein